jgi:RHS repeat-associated protein
MKTLRFLLIIPALAFCANAFAALEQFSARREGTIAVNNTLTVYDAKYFDMSVNPNWSTVFTNQNVSNYVRLGLNPRFTHTADLTATVSFSIAYETWNPTTMSFEVSYASDSLQVSFLQDGYADITDRQQFNFSGAHKVTVTVSGVSGGIPADAIYLEAGIDVERYYTLDDQPVANLHHSVNSDEVRFHWDTKQGAEFYELEWVHINDFDINPMQDLKFDYYLNSTRVDTKKNSYSIPNRFSRGYLLYRVRPVGKQGAGFTERKNGNWTQLVEKGTLADHPFNFIPMGTGFRPGMNWSHSVAYTEDGKRSEAISFVDGMGRAHQSVGKNPVTGQAIVSNVYYDELGRPAVTDLPTPVNNLSLQFAPDFNRSAAPGTPSYNYHYFDSPDSDSCHPVAQGLATTSGAGRYYSPANTNNSGANAAIPDAEGFPFTRVTYTHDLTGRTSSVGAAGADLSIGGGHETQMIYSSINQTELNRLFGSEAGRAVHYQKMVTVDANGQVYTQLFDMAGRMVASYMMGSGPDQLDNIAPGTENNHITLIGGAEDQTINAGEIYSEITYTQYMPDDGEYVFDYSFAPVQFQDECAPSICLDCFYDIEMSITDECGDTVGIPGYSGPIRVNGTVINDMCSGEGFGDFEFSVELEQGNYTIHKRLSVDRSAANDYWCIYQDANECSDQLATYFNDQYEEQDFSACDPGDIDDITDCDAKRQMMLRDVSPGGQYGDVTNNAGEFVPDDVYSVYFNNNLLGADWDALTYLNAAGNPVSLAGGLEWFSDNFRDEWAEQLLQYHPEKCKLDFCYTIDHSYDEAMLSTYTFEDAAAGGFFMPVDGGVPGNGVFSSVAHNNADPSFTAGGEAVLQSGPLLDRMNEYFVLNSVYHMSMWEYAIYEATGCNPVIGDCPSLISDCNRDLIWISFRSSYLEAKNHFLQLAEEAYAQQFCPLAGCIGADPACSGMQERLADRAPRFPHTRQFDAVLSGPDPQNSMEGEIDGIVQQLCQNSCETFADQWLTSLAGCTGLPDSISNPAAYASLRNELIAMCMLGCDADHPQGATTAPPGETIVHGHESVEDILQYHLGGNYMSGACNPYLISAPGPYVLTEDQLAVSLPSLDTCGCNILFANQAAFEAAKMAQTLPAGITTPEQFLAYSNGIDLEDTDHLLCRCEKYRDRFSGQWENSAEVGLAAEHITVPEDLSCAPGGPGCKTCTEMDVLYEQAAALFGGEAAFEELDEYETILTNYMNQQLSFHLMFGDYDRFFRGCHADGTSPYCEPNPEMEEWQDLASLLAHRGQLLGTAVNLTGNNIVYAQGSLKNTLGSSYTGTASNGTLTMSFQQESSAPCTFTVGVTDIPDFDFSKAVYFDMFAPVSGNCGQNEVFTVYVGYYDCGELKQIRADGVSSCISVNNCICGNTGQTLCDDTRFNDGASPCYQPRLDEIMASSREQYEDYLALVKEEFILAYNSKCAEAFDTERFFLDGDFLNYQYTLFYYDQAGNLARTIAPEGVDLLSDDEAINANRQSVQSQSQYDAPVAGESRPQHTYQTTYRYNSYDQVVATGNPDQEGTTVYWYDYFGRIVLSQNPVQRDGGVYSYIFYDAQGRPFESGVVDPAANYTDQQIEAMVKQNNPLNSLVTSWATATGSIRKEITRTWYDKPAFSGVQSEFGASGQQNLRLRVASVTHYETATGTISNATAYVSAIHYSYDLHGNVLKNLQDVPQLAPVLQNRKSTEYEFELVSGNVKKVIYQKGRTDELTHSYEYDAANRLEEVYVATSRSFSGRQAHYRYYDYGPLSRVETGEKQVQGTDYAYTINGWLKLVNGTLPDKATELGRDGNTGYLGASVNPRVHRLFAKDLTAYTLGYYKGDYRAITGNAYEAALTNGTGDNAFSSSLRELWNGNIAWTTTAIADFELQAGVYGYDQLHRLKSMRVFRKTDAAANHWHSALEMQDYSSNYSYDQNGNLQSLLRKGSTTSGISMDNLSYHYMTVQGQPSNRLDYVSDGVTSATVYDDIENDQLAGNYSYDKLGQLLGDDSENLDLLWRKGDRKVQQMKTGSETIDFVYNPMGQRVLKTVKPNNTINSANTHKVTYYSYDANGQVMAVYDLVLGTTNSATLAEQHIYGASRLGLIAAENEIVNSGSAQPEVYDRPTQILGRGRYELTNHLGNVNAVINDRKLWSATSSSYEAVVWQKADYYPFGMPMKDRSSYHLGESYRYGYNGMELDNEPKGNGNSYTTEFRQYDPRLGRWLSLDPLMSQFPWMSPYVAFDNNPVLFTDPLGLAPINGDEGGEGEYVNRELTEEELGGSRHEYHAVGSAPRSHSSQEYQRWYEKNGGADLFNAVANSIYQGKMNTGRALGRAYYGINFRGRVNYPNELLAKWQREADRETVYVLHGLYAAEKSGIDPDELGGFLLSMAPGVSTIYDSWLLDAASTTKEELAIEAGIAFDIITMALPVAKYAIKAFRTTARAGRSLRTTGRAVVAAACFVAGTEIKTADGYQTIENVQIGDSVWAFNPANGQKTLKRVYNTTIKQSAHLQFLIIGNETIITTDDHPFYVNNVWVNAIDLQIGDSLSLLNGGKAVLSNKIQKDTTVTVYNFAVTDYATYYVGKQGILVHNNNPCIQAVDNMAGFFKTNVGTKVRQASTKTKGMFQGQSIYKVNSKIVEYNLRKGDQFYLDGLHKNHIEVFDANGNFRHVMNLDGTINSAKTAAGQGRILK